jgi:hypothetical protein
MSAITAFFLGLFDARLQPDWQVDVAVASVLPAVGGYRRPRRGMADGWIAAWE